ncbi:MAG: hypothetical protein RBR87_07400 [Bacteroidales bacterium]|jgi:hypothetical protein|nr:hypothetical protein [Bacteroidales bacterium]
MLQSRANFWKEYLFPAAILLLTAMLFFRTCQNDFPAHVHAWTQSDRYSLAIGFLENNFDFFHPATLNLQPKFEAATPLQNPQGITSVDFPIVEYLAAALMWFNGSPSPFIFRTLILLIGLAGLFSFFRFLRLANMAYPIAVLVLIIAFAAPVFSYYLNGFIPSVTAVSLVFAALWQLLRYLRNRGRKYFFISLGLFTLAALVRKPFVMTLLSVMLSSIWFGWQQKEKLRVELLSYLIALVLIGSYHTYNKYLSFHYGSLFIGELMPASSLVGARSLIAQAWSNWKLDYFSLPQWIVLAAGMLLLPVLFAKVKASWFSQLLLIALLWLLASLAYLLAMAKQFPAHDYYFLDSFFVPLLLLSALGFSKIKIDKSWRKWSAVLVTNVLVLWMLHSTQQNQQQRYAFKSWDRTEITRLNFEGGAKLLDAAGVSPNAKILVLDAYTTNVPLILLARKGYTVINTNAENLKKAMLFEVDWVVIQNRFLASDVLRNYPELASRLIPVANNGKIGLYKKQAVGQALSFEDLCLIQKQHLLITKEQNNFRSLVAKDSLTACLPINQEYMILVDSLFVQKPGIGLALAFGAQLKAETVNPGLSVVLDISDDQGYHFYDSFSLQAFFESGLAESTSVHLMLNIPAISLENKRIKTYLWNPTKQYLCFNGLKVSLIEYNNFTPINN